jgi:class 3 adenylate cyclase/tetratricopeptide (TPR) repeat protein
MLSEGLRCGGCGAPHAPRQKFCGECGARLAFRPDESGQSAPALGSGERKQVTVLFCDIVDSTPLAARLGPERMHEVITEFVALVRARVGDYEGNLSKFLGDGLMAVFGAPVAREDHAVRAALAALSIRDAVAGRAWPALGGEGRLQIRIGLNSGPVVFGSVGDGEGLQATAIGDTPNVASRMQSQAYPGQVACSEGVAQAIAGVVACRLLGLRELKGKPQPVPVFELLGPRIAQAPQRAGEANGNGGDSLLGRQAEWAVIEGALDNLAKGRGCVITVCGEAGLGKSRLLGELRARAAVLGMQCAHGACISYGKSLGYWPFREALRDGLGLRPAHSEEEALRTLDATLAQRFGADGAGMAPFMALLLGLDPAEAAGRRIRALDGLAVRQQIFRCSLALVEQFARERPLVFILDDWQWADASSVELLRHLLPLAARVPVLFALACRPQQDGVSALVESVAADHAALGLRHHRLDLRPLDEPSARRLVGRSLGRGDVPAQLQAHAFRQAQGNPFYLEELARTLVATGAIEFDERTDQWRRAARSAVAALPEGIESVIQARVDQIDAGAKQLLKVAAVIGRRVAPAVLEAVAGRQAEFAERVARLVDAQMLQRESQHADGDLLFRHPLLHQAVYDSLLAGQRRELHQTVGMVMERLFEARIEEHCALLAHHFSLAEDGPRARKYLLLAGKHAGRIAADAEALALYENAVRAGASAVQVSDPVSRAEIAASMAEALHRLGRNDAALGHALEASAAMGFAFPSGAREIRLAIAAKLARRVARRLFGPPRAPADAAYDVAARLLEVVGVIDYFLDPARFVLGILTLLEEAEKRPRSRALAVGTAALGLIFDTLGQHRLGAMMHRRAMRVAEALGDDLTLGYCNHLLGLHQYGSGQWGAALSTLTIGAAQLERAGHLRYLASCLGASYFVLRSMGDPRWLDLAERQGQLAAAANDEHAIAWAVNAAGVAHLYRGDHAAARPLFEKASIAYEAIPDYRFLSGACARRALCHALDGEVDAALELLARSQALVRRHRIGGISATAAVLVGAEAWLCVASMLPPGARRERVLRQARLACARATRHGRQVGDESAAEALRLSGILACIAGNKGAAARHFDAALKRAGAMGARHVLARTHHDIALRLGEHRHLPLARDLFAQAGAAPLKPAGGP